VIELRRYFACRNGCGERFLIRKARDKHERANHMTATKPPEVATVVDRMKREILSNIAQG